MRSWQWRGHHVSYEVAGPVDAAVPLVLSHGFGSNAAHFRRFAALLAADGHAVFSPDLLGFGASDKPAVAYTPALWAAQLVDFLAEVLPGRPAVLIGNSIGSQVACIAASLAPSRVAGLLLLNCAGGMNARGMLADDYRLMLSAPFISLIEVLLRQPNIARFLFDRFRTRENVAKILQEQARDVVGGGERHALATACG